MPRRTSTERFQRYRRKPALRGMKWADTGMGAALRAPGFREEAHRQTLLLRGAAEENEAPDFIEAVLDAGDSER